MEANEEADSSHHYSLLFFQGTADVLAGLEAIRIHSGCEWTHQVHAVVHPVALSEGSAAATGSVGPNKDKMQLTLCAAVQSSLPTSMGMAH